jgi:DNA-binding beta-propeller fold protein YncE
LRAGLGATAVALLAALGAAGSASAAQKAAFVANYSDATISQYTIGATGALTVNGSPVGTGTEPWFLEVTPDASFLYATDWGSNTVDQYGIGSSGTLSPLTPPQATAGSAPIGLAISPDGRNAYVANDSSGSVSVFDVGSSGTLTLVQTLTTDLSQPNSVAVSPDGLSVYVGDGSNETIVQYDRATNGTLTLKSTPTISAPDAGYSSVAITPDGKNVYATGTGSSSIGEYTVGTGGELTAKSVSSIANDGDVYALTISPNGGNVYGPSCTTGNVDQYSIGTNGELAPLTPPRAAAGNCPEFLWMTASGSHAYVPNFTDKNVSQYNVSSSGALTPMSPPTAPAGGGAGDVIIPPDQGPVAAFTSKAAHVGHASSFSGSGSSDSDGTVVRYDWNFGDGHSLNNGSATPKHAYKRKGTYTVTLTVTDDSGCSTTQVFTGQTAYCNGTSAASITHKIKITAAAKPKLHLSASPHTSKAGKTTCFAFTVSASGHRTRKATIKLAGHSTKTNSHGKAKLCLALKKGTYKATASKKGFVSAATRIKITAASPVFTG